MMKLHFFLAPFLCGVLTLGCTNKTSRQADKPESEAAAVTLPPVETKDKVSDLNPAFQGQTRIAGSRTTAAFQHSIITDKLEKPWAVKALPDGRLLVTEKYGVMRIVSDNGEVSEKIEGFPKVNSNGQGGLLDVVLDSDFSNNRMLYWTYSEKKPSGNATAVAKGELSADEKRVTNVTTIYRAIPYYDGTLHYGSRIVFDADGNLFVSTGERSDLETRPQAQDLDSALGKIVHITKDGKPVNSNPFLNNAAALPEIFSYGHRNPQGLAIHPTTGKLWQTEMGPKGGDELNLITSGKNYGWPVITYGVEYSGKIIGNSISQNEGMEQPIYYWDPVISPSGITFYHNGTISEWENNLFIACLSSTHIARIIMDNDKVVGEERLLAGEKQRFRDITQGKNGALYAVTDSGRLYKIEKK